MTGHLSQFRFADKEDRAHRLSTGPGFGKIKVADGDIFCDRAVRTNGQFEGFKIYSCSSQPQWCDDVRKKLLADRGHAEHPHTLRKVRRTPWTGVASPSTCRGTSALAGTPGKNGPLPMGMGSRSGPRTYFKEEDDLCSGDASEDVEVHTTDALVGRTWRGLTPRSWGTQFSVLSSSCWTVTTLSGIPGLCVHPWTLASLLPEVRGLRPSDEGVTGHGPRYDEPLFSRAPAGVIRWCLRGTPRVHCSSPRATSQDLLKAPGAVTALLRVFEVQPGLQREVTK